jgi:hypothetical protein
MNRVGRKALVVAFIAFLLALALGLAHGAASSTAGGKWQLIPVSIRATSAEFDRVVCPSSQICFATAQLDHSGNAAAAVYKLSSGHWNPVSGPAATSLTGVSCVSAANCWVVGALAHGSAGNADALVGHVSGATWTKVAAPNASGFPSTDLTGVGCTRTGACFAAGEGVDYGPTPSPGHLLVLQSSSGGWSETTVPSAQSEAQAGSGSYLQCPSPKQCILLYNFGTSGGQGDAEGGAIYDGKRWSQLSVPDGVLFQGVSCVRASDCYAIGGASFNNAGLVERLYHFGAGHWSTGPALPARVAGTPIVWSALACPRDGACWAGGGSSIAGEPMPAVMAQLTGNRWSVASIPHVVGQILDITCRAENSCVAVGNTTSSALEPETRALAMRLGS